MHSASGDQSNMNKVSLYTLVMDLHLIFPLHVQYQLAEADDEMDDYPCTKRNINVPNACISTIK